MTVRTVRSQGVLRAMLAAALAAALALALALGASAAQAAACAPGAGSQVNVTVDGLRSGDGDLVVELYADNEDGFLTKRARIARVRERLDRADPSVCLAAPKPGYYAQAGAPYGFHITNFVNGMGMPCWKPPYGTLASYNLKTGKLLWKEPFGEVQKWGFYMPDSWGSVTIGAPLITNSGLIFIGASMDSRVRQFTATQGFEGTK